MRICDLIKSQETYQADIGQTVLETVCRLGYSMIDLGLLQPSASHLVERV